MQSNNRIFSDIFKKFQNEKARNVRLGHGSFITIEFGNVITIQSQIRGKTVSRKRREWLFWIYMSAWRLDNSQKVLVGSNDSKDLICKTLKKLEGKKVLDILPLNSALDLSLFFESGLCLSTFSFETQENDHWYLYTPEEKVFCAGPGSKYSYESAKE
jgi:hypothetical protein